MSTGVLESFFANFDVDDHQVQMTHPMAQWGGEKKSWLLWLSTSTQNPSEERRFTASISFYDAYDPAGEPVPSNGDIYVLGGEVFVRCYVPSGHFEDWISFIRQERHLKFFCFFDGGPLGEGQRGVVDSAYLHTGTMDDWNSFPDELKERLPRSAG